MKRKQRTKRKHVASAGACAIRFVNWVDGGFGEHYVPEILLIQSVKGSSGWGIPKGHQEKGETLQETALREVFEETGLHVKLGPALPTVVTKNHREIKNVYSWVANIVGDCEPCPIDPDCEIKQAAWHPLDNLPKIYVYQRPIIDAVAELLRNGFNPREKNHE